jgi:branched-chain amino acid transport system substrate-binding protein
VCSSDLGPYLAEIRALNPPVVYCWFGGTDAVRFVQQYREFGIKAKLVGFASLIDSTTLAAQGRAALGVFSSTIYTDTLENPTNRHFVAGYRERYKNYPNLYAEYGFTAAQVLDASIAAAGGSVADKDRLAEAMAHVKFDAPRGPFRFDPEVHHPIQNVYICEVQEIDGRIADRDIATIRNVRDPGKKEASAQIKTRNT